MIIRGRGLAVGALALILASCGSAPPASSPFATAADACRHASGGGAWGALVEVDRAEGSALVMATVNPADGNVGTCLASRARAGGGFGATTFAEGRSMPASPQPLTYSSGMASTDGSPFLLLGRVPASTASVRLVFGDGSAQPASLGGGFWLAWLAVPAEPVAIEALDASGALVGRIADPDGVQPSPV